MAYFKNHWKARENKEISASGLADMARTCDWVTKLRVSAPLTLSNIAGGPLIGLATSGSAQIAVTNGTISACVANSGSCTGSGKWVAGTGTVNPVSYNGTCLVTNTSASISVLNFSTTTGGISTGTLVWIQQDPSGNWVITAVDCGN
jgi:hypothetical protein